MPVLTPTADERARSVHTEMTSVDPVRVMPQAELDGFLAGTGLNGPYVAAVLSDVLTHQRCGTHLYRSVAARTHNPMLKGKYEQFGAEALDGVAVLENLITQLGGDPMYVSPAARATEKGDSSLVESTFMLNGSIDVMTQEQVMLDAVLLAAAKGDANWSCLAQMVDSFPEGEYRDSVANAVGLVAPQEQDHLEWARETRCKMISLQASSSTMAQVGAKAEEMVARVKGWFS